MNLDSVKLNITKNINMDINNNTNMMNTNDTNDTNNTTNNPFMKKTIKKTNEHEPEKSDRWANLDICEDDQGNRFMSDNDNEDDPFRKKNNAFSRNSQPETSRNFRRGETFNYSLQFGETPSFVDRNKNFKGGSNFMKFTKKKPPPPPPEFHLDKMGEDQFPSLG
jgi:hypothetical protein